MPTTFIALQCCQCSTMQVKQLKKSSNKWTCVVCNQKQSIRKVYAQGFMAKDVRHFVQSFNMSRLSAAANSRAEESLPDPAPLPTNRKRRSHWTDCPDPDETITEEEEKELENVNEPKIVTELPTELFKRPRLMKNYLTGSDSTGSERALRPNFPKRNTLKHSTATDAEEGSSKCQPMMDEQASIWADYAAHIGNDKGKGNDPGFKHGRDSADCGDDLSHDFLLCAIDQRVEDDIHPDFM